MRTITAADLFCGAGGTSTGLTSACARLGYGLDLTAINHWDVAIGTHSQNHPNARHLCESLDSVDPRKLYPSGRLDFLAASPECTHFSIARGGKPCSDQSRASAWHIVRWAEALYINTIMVENVRELLDWGPLSADGQPLKSKKGATFRAFVAALESLGYTVDWRILCAADYGDPTTRERLCVIAKRGTKKVTWPAPTHARHADEQPDPFLDLKPWRPASEVIDRTLTGSSIYNRRKPLVPATVRRIDAGLRHFPGEPFLIEYYGTDQPARSLSDPLATITTKDRFGLVEPDPVTADVRLRMLQPRELAAAMSFPLNYRISGTRTEQVKQIGNAVPAELAAALCRHNLPQRPMSTERAGRP
jgi:DNA (cytosine-5)-methyltransferase 1